MIINLNNVCFSYPETPNKKALNIPSWTIAAKESVFVYGPSGSGKSTLLNLLSGMLVSDQGDVSILNKSLNKMSAPQRDRFRAKHIGYVFQQFNLIPYLNAVENIQLATNFAKNKKQETKQEIENLLKKLNIQPSEWQKPTSQLSIGQQQRVAIARALINKPEILIADEPTSSLDQDNRDNFMSVLLSLVEENNMTLVFVSHDKTLSKHFKRVESLSDINRLSGEKQCS